MTQDVKLPNTADVEATVIGAIITQQDYITQVVDFLHPEHFSNGTYRAIYECLCSMYDNGKDIDLITATTACKALNLQDVNVTTLITRFAYNAPTTPSIVNYAKIITESFIRRKLYLTIRKISEKCTSESGDVADILNELDKLTDECNGAFVGGGATHISKVIDETIKDAENRQKTHVKGGFNGITTGIDMLNNKIGGFKPSQLIVLAARPAMGKTSIMLHFALSASKQGKAVCIYSLEMASISLADRILLSVADVDAEHYRNGTLTSEEWDRINKAQEVIAKLPIYIDDNPQVTMRYIRTQSKMLQKRGQCDIILADYLQLVDTSTGKNRNREQEIANASRSAKIIAKELKVPFVLLSQLSRKVEDRADKTPQLSDLRESGAIEQDADIVMFIHRPAYYREEHIETSSMGTISAEGVGILTIAKQRDGATGNVLFLHNKALTKITNYQDSHSPF